MCASTARSVCIGPFASVQALVTYLLLDSAAVLLMISKPLKADDLKWSPKDLCSKNSLLE